MFKIKKKYVKFSGGYIRFNKVEINWDLRDWALPLEIDCASEYFTVIRILCVSFYISNTGKL